MKPEPQRDRRELRSAVGLEEVAATMTPGGRSSFDGSASHGC
jgi:hypothetical protein